MAGNLPRLAPVTPQQHVEVQDTTFAVDVLGRYLCNTWEEATTNPNFDAVVIGAGMFGAYCAEKIYRAGASAGLRVLVLDAGALLVTEHVQNLTNLGLNAPGPVAVPSDAEDPGMRSLDDPNLPQQTVDYLRCRVWGIPWRSALGFPGLAYCLGGRSLYWGGWAPRLTDADLAGWPAGVADYLRNNYGSVEREIGVAPDADYISGPLYEKLLARFQSASAGLTSIDGIEPAPLAIQASAPASGLFSFDKYSSAPILAAALRDAAKQGDASRRLFLVPRAHVTRLQSDNGAVTGIEVRVNGQPKFLPVSPDCAVVLANGTIESTRLAMESFPTPRMGSNLMGHLRSNITVRIRRDRIDPTLPTRLEAAALLVRGSTPDGRYHLQVTASAQDGSKNPEDVMFRMIPDIDLLDSMLASQESEWVVLTLRGIGEMTGDKASSSGSAATSWMDLSPFQRDQFQRRRAWVHLVKTPADENVWKAMYAASVALAEAIAVDPGDRQYLYKGNWQSNPPPDIAGPGEVRDGLGTTHHEAGTLWIGTDASDSVTDSNGRFHHVSNAYVAGPAIFPTLGSANPSLTALALARKTAVSIVQALAPQPEQDFLPLFSGDLSHWKMAGVGAFRVLPRNVLESDGGTGLLWYAREQFDNFVLRVDWRTSQPTDNSGVYIRLPALGMTGTPNDFAPADQQAFEIQIDDRGFDAASNTTGDPLKKTGAIYNLAPARADASRPPGQWNTFEIHAIGTKLAVTLNGKAISDFTDQGTRLVKGFIGLQSHHPGAKVQFRNIRIKRLTPAGSPTA